MAIPWNARIIGVWRDATIGQIVRDAAQQCHAPMGQIDDGPVVAELVCDGETLDDLTLRLLLQSPLGSTIGGRDGVLIYQAG